MELIVEKTAKANPVVAKKLPLSNFLVPLLGGSAIFFSEAFLFNPLIVAVLFLSFNISWKNYLFTMLTMVLSAYFINLSYGVEISLISITLLALCLGFARAEKYPRFALHPVVIINIFLGILMLSRSFSILYFGIVVIAGTLSIVIAQSFVKFYQALIDKTATIKPYEIIIFLMTVAISGMFNLVIGLIMFRLVLLLGKKVVKKEQGIIACFLGALVLYVWFNLNIEIITIIILPIMISYFIKEKYYLYTYLLLSFAGVILYDSNFLSNGLLYQNIASALVCLSISSKQLEKIREIFFREDNLTIASLSEDEGKIKNRIDELYRYIDIITNSLDRNSVDPYAKATSRVISRVCSKCQHMKYCKLYFDIKSFLNEKPLAKNKKKFAQECISPYKFSLELMQAYNIFLGESNYFYEANQRREQFVVSLEQIKKPIELIATELRSNTSLKERIIGSLEKEGISIKALYANDSRISLVTKNVIDLDMTLMILHQCLNTNFECVKQEKDYFRDEDVYVFQPICPHKVLYYTYSKSVNPLHSGDYYDIKSENKSISVLLCDGMGHDENAHIVSNRLGNVFSSLRKISNDMHMVINELNSILRFNSESDNYATLDFFHLDLQDLSATFYKAGAFTSFLLSQRGILEIDSSGLPLGILDVPDYSQNKYLLKEKDILLIVSDGIGEVLLNSKDLLNNYWKMNSLNEFGRDLFAELCKRMEHQDDATLIILQVL